MNTVKTIRKEFGGGRSTRDLSEEYGIRIEHCRNVVNNRCWHDPKWVNPRKKVCDFKEVILKWHVEGVKPYTIGKRLIAECGVCFSDNAIREAIKRWTA
jgi:hypothetical protein